MAYLGTIGRDQMEVVSLRDLERISRERTVKDMWDFIDGAAFDEVSKRRNESKF